MVPTSYVRAAGRLALAVWARRFYRQPVKQMWLLVGLLAAALARGQDAAVEERLNKLDGYVQELLAAQADLQKRLAALAGELDALREQNRSNGAAATQEDVKRLAEAIREVDRKRLEDYEKIRKEIEKLARALVPAPPPKTPSKLPPKESAPPGGPPEKGFEHVVAENDTLSTIALAYREKGFKVTVDQILKANPGLNPNRLKIGQKIFIPAPPDK